MERYFVMGLHRVKILSFIFAALISVPILGGCGNPVNVAPLTAEEVPQFEATGNYPHKEYHIEPGDTLRITYTFHPEMSQDTVVLPDGRIAAQMVGEITVSGMTTAQLEKTLKEKTSDRLRNPEILVSVVQFAERSVYIGGEVGKPGIIPYRKGLSPLQAVIAAGGFLDTAQPDSVVLIRTGGSETNLIARKVNLSEVVTDGAKEPIYLAPHDIVYVPRSSVADANLWVKQHITDLFPFLRGSLGMSYRPGF